MQDIQFYNSLTNRVEKFKPIKEKEVSIYVCGSTVYDSPHIGNIRPIIVFDVLRRMFKECGFNVTFITNFTDIDDKIINRAIEKKITEKELTTEVINEIISIYKNLNALEPTYTLRVSDNIQNIIDYIKHLIESGAAYEVDGDVFFRVEKSKDYPRLFNQTLDELKAGARIETDSKKENPFDFALWKKTDVGIKFQSPWGLGRPGWHTECVVMIESKFHEGLIDIHGGGYDLKFPHHSNEIAQNDIFHHNNLANYWLHNGFVTFGTEKMSKSLGNVKKASSEIKSHGGNVVRMVLLSSPYRSNLPYNDETIENARIEVFKIFEALQKTISRFGLCSINYEEVKSNNLTSFNLFLDALKNDLNFANAKKEVFDVIKLINTELRKGEHSSVELLKDYFFNLKKMIDVLGFNFEYQKITDEDKKMYDKYLSFKKEKNFEKSDELRNILMKKNIL